jgi:hypothetical protein
MIWSGGIKRVVMLLSALFFISFGWDKNNRNKPPFPGDWPDAPED